MTDALRIDLDRSSPMPLYHQIASAIDGAIEDGTLQPGDLLENELSLAARLDVSRPTTRQALQELVDRGRLVRRRGVGTRVAPTRVHRPAELTSLHGDLAGAYKDVSTQVISYERTPAPADAAEALEVAVGDEVVAIQRLRLADGEPLALLTNWLPVAIAPGENELAVDGLYNILRRRGILPKVARQRIGARIEPVPVTI